MVRLCHMQPAVCRWLTAWAGVVWVAAVPATASAIGPVKVRVSHSAVSAPIAPGFVGFSFEFGAVETYAGPDPRAINPVLVQLVRDVAPGQAPVLRIGGNSTDDSWWPTPGVAS